MRRRPYLAVLWLATVCFGGCHRRYYPGDNGSGGAPGGDAGSGGDDASVPQCSGGGLACQVNHQCAGGGHTTVTGTAFAPNGTLPLYNAIISIPSKPLDPFPSGVTCDRCDGKVSGEPLASALTGPDGRFTLKDVPTGADIPIVIQLGRWRRETVIPAVADCADTPIAPQITRLPRNAGEGSIPQMAIATGNADPFECLLLKLGLDATEITSPDAPVPGRVHFFRATDAPGLDLQTPAPRANLLYSSLSNLLKYDVLLMPCEGGPYDKSNLDGSPLTPDPRVLLSQYVDAGGRLFSTHYSYDWLTYGGSIYNKLAAPARADGQWPVGQTDDFNRTIAAQLAITFPKGADFARWLGFAGAQSAPNHLNIDQGRHDITGVDPVYAQSWATYNFAPVGGGPGVMHFTFNTPLDAPKDDMGVPAYCGRVVFSDFHVTANAVANSSNPFPQACKHGDLTDQEKALAFMLFDLSSCVQQDSTPPIP